VFLPPSFLPFPSGKILASCEEEEEGRGRKKKKKKKQQESVGKNDFAPAYAVPPSTTENSLKATIDNVLF
jgi:hypothetical protein